MFSGRVGIDPFSLKVLLVAFTGSAAFIIHGTTIHHAFHIPFGCKLLPYQRLPAEERRKIRDVLMDLLCLIIDEISMTGATLLYYLHRRLQNVFENDRPFGGIPVLACGDLYQLKPVSDGYCFQGIEVKDSSGQTFAVSNIWIDTLRCMN
jgi:ATP-dependent DNA helicase PIF1